MQRSGIGPAPGRSTRPRAGAAGTDGERDRMAYLFWTFAAVWIWIFLYLYALTRKSRALAGEIEVLRERLRKDTSPTF